MMSGNQSLTGQIGGQDVTFELTEKNQGETEFIFEGVFPTLDAGEYEVSAVFASNLEIRNVYGQELDKSLAANQLLTAVTAAAGLPTDHVAVLMRLTERFEEEGEFSNNLAVRSLKTHLTAVARYEKQAAAEKVVKHLESFKVLLDYQLDNQLMTEKAYKALQASTDELIQKWQ